MKVLPHDKKAISWCGVILTFRTGERPRPIFNFFSCLIRILLWKNTINSYIAGFLMRCVMNVQIGKHEDSRRCKRIF